MAWGAGVGGEKEAKEASARAREGASARHADAPAGAWVDGAGGLLLLAGAHGTALLPTLEQATAATAATAAPGSRLARLRPATRAGLTRTLLFLHAVGLRRPWDLRAYSGAGLAVLSERPAYGYRAVERFLRELAAAGGGEALSDALGAWATRLWHAATPREVGAPPSFYIDGHRKAVYSDVLLPRTPAWPGRTPRGRAWLPRPDPVT